MYQHVLLCNTILSSQIINMSIPTQQSCYAVRQTLHIYRFY